MQNSPIYPSRSICNWARCRCGSSPNRSFTRRGFAGAQVIEGSIGAIVSGGPPGHRYREIIGSWSVVSLPERSNRAASARPVDVAGQATR